MRNKTTRQRTDRDEPHFVFCGWFWFDGSTSGDRSSRGVYHIIISIRARREIYRVYIGGRGVTINKLKMPSAATQTIYTRGRADELARVRTICDWVCEWAQLSWLLWLPEVLKRIELIWLEWKRLRGFALNLTSSTKSLIAEWYMLA